MTRKQRHTLGAIATFIVVAVTFWAILSTSHRNTNKMLEVWGAQEQAVKRQKAADKATRESDVAYIADVSLAGRDKPYPANGRPEQKTPFPELKERSSLSIKLKRAVACSSECVEYTVEVRGNGDVAFVGPDWRVRQSNVSLEKVDMLLNAFRQADFFWLYDEYHAGVKNMDSAMVSISFDGHTHSVLEQAGQQMNMPSAVTDLEHLIDEVADTKRWISPTGHLAK